MNQTVTVDELENRLRVERYEVFTGHVEITTTRDSRPAFCGKAIIWWRRGSNRKRIVAFWDMRPWAASSSLMAERAPHMVRIAADDDPDVARRTERLRGL